VNYEAMTFKQISEATGISYGTILSRYYRGGLSRTECATIPVDKTFSRSYKTPMLSPLSKSRLRHYHNFYNFIYCPFDWSLSNQWVRKGI